MPARHLDRGELWVEESGTEGSLPVLHGTGSVVEEAGRYRLTRDPRAAPVGAPPMPGLLAAAQADVLDLGEHDPRVTGEQLRALPATCTKLLGIGHIAQVKDPGGAREPAGAGHERHRLS